MTYSKGARLAAAAVALVAWFGLAVQLRASIELTGSVPAAIWAMLRYFTVLSNLLLAVVLTGVALGAKRLSAPWLVGGTALALLLVGVVYGLLLRGLLELSGGARLADTLMHYVTPTLAPLFWLAYAPKGALRLEDPVRWALFPLAYLAYALVRGMVEGLYAYPFINLARLGWSGVGINAAAIAGGFLMAGLLLVWLDARLARTRGG